MPVKSAKQFRFMEAAAHEGLPGIKKSVAREFLNRTSESKKSAFAKAYRKKKK